MAEFVTRIRTESGDKQIDYRELGNLPTVNNKELKGDITLTATDVGAAPNTLSINGKSLSGDVTLTAADVGASPSSHTHDDIYYTELEINTKLSGKSDSNHTHDDRYYTESEINTKLSGKSDTTHTHKASDVGAAASGHNHDEKYLKKYELNGIDIDNTGGNWTVDIAEPGHGTVPETWVNVTQTTSGHFIVQTAIKVNKSDDQSRNAGSTWRRDKYNGSAWSAWTVYGNPCCSARGDSASLSLAETVITPLTLNQFITNSTGTFTFDDGGIRIPKDGTVLVSGSVYIYGSNSLSGVYIIKKDHETNLEDEITSTLIPNLANTAPCPAPVIVDVAVGDIIKLCARDRDGSSCIPNNPATHLDIVYL